MMIGDNARLLLRLGNRHGLIAGGTGTGKTVTLMTLAESFSRAGVPVFVPDMKGDVSGLASANPCAFYDLFGTNGAPIRASIESVGAPLLSRALELNATQEGTLNIVFRVAVDRRLPLVTLADLRAAINATVTDRAKVSARYGLVSPSSIGAIQRGLLSLENDGADKLFTGQPIALDDIMRTAPCGQGVITILAAESLATTPRVYSMFLLWMLSRLFDELPEVGNPDRPRLVMIFDESHLLFRGAPASFVQGVEQVVRLIRSKGVGLYFCSQTPSDIPGGILSQLGNRIQHGLRAYTPRDWRALRVAAESFPTNPDIDTVTAIAALGVGQALTSMLRDDGTPSPVALTQINLPACRLGPATDAERRAATPRVVVPDVVTPPAVMVPDAPPAPAVMVPARPAITFGTARRDAQVRRMLQ